MNYALADIAATWGAGRGATDLERRVAASEPASGRDTGSDVRVVARHGICTVSAAGTFIGDYLDEEAALASAVHARGRREIGGAADPWQAATKEVRP
jgi:hypothetical protein